MAAVVERSEKTHDGENDSANKHPYNLVRGAAMDDFGDVRTQGIGGADAEDEENHAAEEEAD